MSKEFLVVIPARFKSSRFPGKPLIEIKGKSMIQRVWEKCVLASDEQKVIIATDDETIFEHCHKKGMKVIMTPEDCLTGTDRVSEVSKMLKADFYINVQGDEPMIDPKDISDVIEAFRKQPGRTFCAMSEITSASDYNNKNIPKVVVRSDQSLLYISRAGIPSNKEGRELNTMKQVCIYAFPRSHLREYGVGTKKTDLETIEDIELLRLLELGYDVNMVKVSSSSIAIDTPEDLKKVISRIDEEI